MRTELANGRWLLCGHILPNEQVKVGQVWAPASGGNHTVTVVEVSAEWVTYEGDYQARHEKLIFAFQCRYCLVLPTADIPEELL